MSTNNGGPAFPGEQLVYRAGYQNSERAPVPGMSLRDYFAAKAIGGALSGGTFDYSCIEDEARMAYEIADAMLAARDAK